MSNGIGSQRAMSDEHEQTNKGLAFYRLIRCASAYAFPHSTPPRIKRTSLSAQACLISACCRVRSGTNAKHYCTYQIAQGNQPKIGDVCLAKPQDAHPTQAAYGEVDAGCFQLGLEAYASSKDGSLRAYLQSKTVPTIIGPDGKIRSRHHIVCLNQKQGSRKPAKGVLRRASPPKPQNMACAW